MKLMYTIRYDFVSMKLDILNGLLKAGLISKEKVDALSEKVIIKLLYLASKMRYTASIDTTTLKVKES